MMWALVGVGVLVACITGVAGWWIGRHSITAADRDAAQQRVRVDAPTVPAAVVDDHPIGVVIANPDGTVRYRNAAARELAGTHLGVLIDAAIERHLQASLAGTDGEETVELYGPPKMVVQVASTRLPGGGAVVYTTDITEARRLDQVRTDFVANISHELKTPIGAMSVLAETLVDETDVDTMTRIVDRLIAEAERATHTVNDLMELSRIEHDDDRVDAVVAVGDIIRASIDRVAAFAQQRAIGLSTLEPVGSGRPFGGAQPGSALQVHGDRRQLVSAIGNLVENAVKYSEHGGQVAVRARTTDQWVEIAVNDEGVGIPQRDLDRIFERFYRVDRARSRATGGTGLGLSIVRHVAQNHDGEVVVSSTEGTGSTFVFRLPLTSLVTDPTVERKEGVA